MMEKCPVPGDSSRDLFIHKRWRSRTTFPKGQVNSPSQKDHFELPGSCFFQANSKSIQSTWKISDYHEPPKPGVGHLKTMVFVPQKQT